MKAVVAENFGKITDLAFKECPMPVPQDDEVLIEVSYAGVNPVDWKSVAGFLKKVLPHEFPLTPGWDVSGVVREVGSAVSSLAVGDHVFSYCRKPTVQQGTYAEYITAYENMVAVMPKTITFAEAAAIPLVALTAWQGLFEIARLQPAQTVLIHAGAGGVGSMAVQLAKYAGAKVYTTTRRVNHEYVYGLGADVAIDYTKDPVSTVMHDLEPHGVDIVFDGVGGETLESSFDLVKEEGYLVGIVNKPDKDKAEEHGIQTGFVFVAPNRSQLEKVGSLIDQGHLKPPYVQEIPFEQYQDALEQLQTERTRGKVVLKVR